MEDLECNPMYLALQSKFRKHYDAAIKVNGCCFLIPCSDSLQKAEITEDVLDIHIMKPSPYFKGEFINLFGAETRTVQIENSVIKRLTGFTDQEDVNIIGEEKGYAEDGKEFYIYVISSPLGILKKKLINEQMDDLDIPQSWLDGSSTGSLIDCKRILQSMCKGKVLVDVDTKARLLLTNYLFLPDYLGEASCKLHGIIERIIRDISVEVMSNKRTMAVLPMVVENYLMNYLHNNLFPVICERFAVEDKRLKDKVLQLYSMDVSSAQLGALEIFSCPLPAAVVELARLDSLNSPREKVQCLKNTIDLIAAEVKQHLLETRGLLTPPSSLPCLTTDDLIPVLLTAIVRARLFHLASDVYYIEHFLWSISTKDIHSYSIVTFKAAIEFLKTVEVTRLSSTKNQLKKELSPEELMEVTEKLQQKSKLCSRNSDDVQWTPVDRQMERITRMIEASTRELNSVQHHGVSSTSKQTNVDH